MRTRLMTLPTAILLSLGPLLAAGGTQASAHPGHTSCAGGAVGVVDVGQFPGSPYNDQGVSGEAASIVAQQGLVDEALVAIHAYCEPRHNSWHECSDKENDWAATGTSPPQVLNSQALYI